MIVLATRLFALSAASGQAEMPGVLSPGELKSRVDEVNWVQTPVMMRGATIADTDRLFAEHTEDFSQCGVPQITRRNSGWISWRDKARGGVIVGAMATTSNAVSP